MGVRAHNSAAVSAMQAEALRKTLAKEGMSRPSEFVSGTAATAPGPVGDVAGGGAPEAENQPPQLKQEVDLANGATMTIHSLGGGGGGGIDGNAQPNAGAPAPNQLREVKPLQTVPRIYLCSRTHSQLHQLVRELKRTPYRPKYTILGRACQI